MTASRSSGVLKGEGWSGVVQRDKRVRVLSTDVVAPHEDDVRKLLGDPAPGRSALDEKRRREATVAALPSIWSKISAIGDDHRGEAIAGLWANGEEEEQGE